MRLAANLPAGIEKRVVEAEVGSPGPAITALPAMSHG
jgi:hypothetical protein